MDDFVIVNGVAEIDFFGGLAHPSPPSDDATTTVAAPPIAAQVAHSSPAFRLSREPK
jgi:hypothetical protein